MIQNPEKALSQLYFEHFGVSPFRISKLKGDGSDRKIFRLFSDNLKSIIGICGATRAENDAFVSFSRAFYEQDFPVAEILIYDADKGIYLETDFGDTTLYSRQRELGDLLENDKSVRNVYKRVIRWLIKFQITGRDCLDFSKCYQYPSFGKEAMQYDLDYFVSSFLSRFVKIKYDQNKLQQDFDRLIHHLLEADADYFLYRDFQSKNIMLQDGAPFFIDYQSGRKGALQYDLASLLFDANLRVPNTLRESMLYYYLETIDSYIALNETDFVSYFYDFALIRMLQALAAFSFLAHQKNKSYFLQNIPNALDNIQTLFDKPCILSELNELRRLFETDFLVNPLLEMLREEH